MNFLQLLILYVFYVFIFSLQLFAGELMFSAKFVRRDKFALRVVLSLLGFFGFSILPFCIQIWIGNTIYGMILIYLLLFAGTLFAGVVCYKEPIWNILFCACAGYTIQNFTSKIFSLLLLSNVIMKILMSNIWMFMLLEILFFCAIYVGLYFAFAKRARNYASKEKGNWRVILFSATTLLVTIGLSAFADVYARESLPLNIAAKLFSIVCCLFILFFYSGMLERSRLQQELEIVQSFRHKEESQFELLKENVEIINLKCHDLKYQIKALRKQEGDIQKESLKDIESAIAIYDLTAKTGNETLDIILTEKSLYCEKNNIRFSCMADGKSSGFVAPVDLYSLLGNAIENAIEAVMQLDDSDLRVISLIMKEEKGFLIIRMDNYFKGNLQFENGLPQTTKNDKNYHGFGMKSMKIVIDKYGGHLSSNCYDEVFRLHIMLPLP